MHGQPCLISLSLLITAFYIERKKDYAIFTEVGRKIQQPKRWNNDNKGEEICTDANNVNKPLPHKFCKSLYLTLVNKEKKRNFKWDRGTKYLS